jgi:hypothetical protein
MPNPNSPSVLSRDNLRSLFAAAIALLTVGGWIYSLTRSPLRDALAVQTRLWWIEQIVGLVLAIVCIGIILRKRAFLTPAFWLTVYSLVFDVMRWLFEFADGQVRVPVAMFLYALFLWRLRLTRRALAAERAASTIDTTV